MEVTPQAELPESFDHVIFACHSDQALQILGTEATAQEREILAALPYQRNEAVLHTDVSLLPKRRRAWACWNFRLGSDEAAAPTVTYNLNLLQHLAGPETLCLTLNDRGRVAERHVLRRFEFQHPVFTTARSRAQSRHSELLASRRTSFCGAYWRNGFHEDGVRSGLAVAAALTGQPVERPPYELSNLKA